MKYRYDVGDAVVVKRDLRKNCSYFMMSGPNPKTYNTVVDEMKELEGKTVHIAEHIDGQYFIEEDNKSYDAGQIQRCLCLRKFTMIGMI